MYTTLMKISRYISVFGFASTVLFNTLLIILTGWYLKIKLGAYKHLIIIFSIIGMVFDSLDFIFHPTLLSVNSGFIAFVNMETKLLSKETLTVLISIYGASFYISTSFLAVMFIHRYFSVVKPAQLYHFQRKRIILWVSYTVFNGSIFFFTCNFLCRIDEFSKNYFSEQVFQAFHEHIDEIPGVTVIVVDNFGIRWKNVVFLIICQLTLIFQNIIIIYCGRKIRRKLYSKDSTYSTGLRNLHKQFFKTLVFQVVTPTILLFVPTLILFYLPFFGIQMNFPIGVTFCLFTLYPAIDSCIVMYVITEYRKALREFLRDIYGRRKETNLDQRNEIRLKSMV
ncbi:unnamed protein product [Caenorhabditis angaria]|uniref:Seven TM Receptor n=1 Tax=Caenorhabditis angaria TaxID=860376 RepID=A0A9P1N793_9PELO|nr:unnamed protein product [Caenorhabditis angaria]